MLRQLIVSLGMLALRGAGIAAAPSLEDCELKNAASWTSSPTEVE